MKNRLLPLLAILWAVMTPSVAALAQSQPAQSREYDMGLAAYNRGDFEAAFNYWRPLAEEGHVRAMVFIGFMYQRGLGLENNYREAAKWFMKAANLGSEEARRMLADPFRGIEPSAENYAEALKWYRSAAAGGSAGARYALAKLYAEGRYGLEVDLPLAVEWMMQAARQGHVEAQYDLALIYDFGAEGIPQDFMRALFWYQAAAERGHRQAQYGLGEMYYYAREAPVDYEQAIAWINGQDFEHAFSLFKRSAQQGYPPAQLRVAEMYRSGEGVETDPVQAYTWATLAYRSLDGAPDAARKKVILLRDDLALMLARGQVRIAEKLAAAWAPRPEEIVNQKAVASDREPPPYDEGARRIAPEKQTEKQTQEEKATADRNRLRQ